MKLINKEGIDIIIEQNKKTPRAAVSLYFVIKNPEKYAGVYTLLSKLLFQGTHEKSAEKLAQDLENNGIEMGARYKQNFLRVSSLSLNEDLPLALDIMSDILQNSTLEEFDKEVFKTKGEIISELDNPKVKLMDSFVREMFKGHFYGNSYTKILEDIDNIKKDDIKDALDELLNSKKVLVFSGDYENEEEIVNLLSMKLPFMKNYEFKNEIPYLSEIKESKIVKIPKDDVEQAQIIQGWCADSITSEDYPKISVMNNILGASGLSSRLFYELRDKLGLAYHVRSSYEVSDIGGVLSIYIATSPHNIKKCLEGFQVEIKRMQDEFVTDEELQGGKENVLGKIEYFSQTNLQRANSFGYDWIMGLGINYDEKYRELINSVTKEDVMEMARKYFTDKSIIIVLAPEKFLQF